MKEFFIELFEYNNHYNQKLLDLITDNLSQISEKSQSLINHIINAHQIWNARVLMAQSTEIWLINDWHQLPFIDHSNYQMSLHIIDEFNLYKIIKYNNMEGKIYSNTVKDILFQIINHSTYHRGQIASDLRQHAIEPINTDYIFFKR